MSPRSLRSVAHRLALDPTGRLASVTGTDRSPVVRHELELADPIDLMGLDADPAWQGVGIVAPVGAEDPSTAAAALVVDRRGRAHVTLGHRGALHDVDVSGGLSGFMADLALRMLGLPTPPEATTTAELALRVWVQRLLDTAADPDTAFALRRWSDIVARHPAWWCGALTTAAPHHPDDVVDATAALGRRLTWERLRRSVGAGESTLAGLSARDARWMDWPFFARWTLDLHRPVTELLDDLSLFLDGALLRDVRYTVEAASWLGFAPTNAS